MTQKQGNKKEYHSVILAALLHDIGRVINVTRRPLNNLKMRGE